MALYTERTIEEIKKRITISDVMRDYAQIVHRGGKDWVKCPFHGSGNERTPSCMIDNSTGRYYCFGCHAAGDIFTLLKEKEGLDFPSAVEELAKRAGVQLEEVKSGNSNKKASDERQMFYDVYERLSKTFNYLLLNHPEAEGARAYLKQRNVSSEMIETFRLGYAPRDGRWLYGFLKKNQYSDEFLKRSGLFSQNYEGLSLFSNRLMFPIRDKNGRVLAFSGRDLSGNSKAKYINSPETPIYQKKENFFGLFEARKTIATGTLQPILCEGNFDVVAMHQAGYTSAIASLGTAFTVEQFNSITRLYSKVKEFHLLFDSDEAGQNETVKAIQLVHSRGLGVLVHKFESAKDASELLQKEGKEGVDREFAHSLTGFEYLVQRARNRYDITNAKGRFDFMNSLSEFILTTPSSVERDGYILHIASMFGIKEDTVKADLENSRKKAFAENGEEVVDSLYNQPRRSYDLFAVLFLANHREAFKAYRRRLQLGDLEDPESQVIYTALENAMRKDIKTPELLLSTITDDKIRNDVATSFALDEYQGEDFSALEEAIMRIEIRSLEKQRNILTTQLKLIPDTAEQEESLLLLERKQEVDNNIRRIKKELLKSEEKEA